MLRGNRFVLEEPDPTDEWLKAKMKKNVRNLFENDELLLANWL